MKDVRGRCLIIFVKGRGRVLVLCGIEKVKSPNWRTKIDIVHSTGYVLCRYNLLKVSKNCGLWMFLLLM